MLNIKKERIDVFGTTLELPGLSQREKKEKQFKDMRKVEKKR